MTRGPQREAEGLCPGRSNGTLAGIEQEGSCHPAATSGHHEWTERQHEVSKYDPLWDLVGQSDAESLQLSFQQVNDVLGFAIDHSFLTFKKELLDYGYQVAKVSLKHRVVSFERVH